MGTIQKSLIDYLRIENPVLDARRCPPGGNTKSENNSWETPQSIEVWEDFKLESLSLIYGGQLRNVLEHPFQLYDHSAIPLGYSCQFYDEISLERLLWKWNQPVVSEALSAAQNHLGTGLTHGNIDMVGGSEATCPENPRLCPDWAGIKRLPILTGKSENLLPGDTKVSKKWLSGAIKLGPVEEAYQNLDWLSPLSQVFTYCVRSNARYGYIITDKELVVLRIRPGSQINSQSAMETRQSLGNSDLTPAQRARNAGILEYYAIPWETNGSQADNSCDGMTVNLALWSLYMMAAESHTIEEHYMPLARTVRNSNSNVVPRAQSDDDHQTRSSTYPDIELGCRDPRSTLKTGRRGRKCYKDRGRGRGRINKERSSAHEHHRARGLRHTDRH